MYRSPVPHAVYSQSGIGHQDVHQSPEHAQIWEQYRLQQQLGAAQQHHHQQQLSANKVGPASSAPSHTSPYSGSHKTVGSVPTPSTMEEALHQHQQHMASLIVQGQMHPALKFQYEQARSASSGHSPEVLQAQVVQSMAGSMQTAGVPHAMPVYPSMEMMAQMAHAQAQAASQSQQQQHAQQMSALQQQQQAQMAAIQQQYAMMQGTMPAFLPLPMMTPEQYQAYQSAMQGSHVQQWKMLEQMMQQPEMMQQVMMAQYMAAQQQQAQQAQQGQQQSNGSGPAPIHKPVIVNT